MKLSLKQTLLILVLILTPLFLSLLPFFIQSYMSPIDRVFMGLHRWSEDYYGYLQSINQGLMGHITNVSKLTLQPHQPTFVHSEYVILGFVGHFIGLNSPLVYHLSRLFLGAVFVFVAFYFLYYLSSLSLREEIPHCHCEQSEAISMTVRDRLRNLKNQFDEIATPRCNIGARNDRLGITLISFFLAFFVGGFPHITSLQPLHLEPYLSWWTELDVLTRSAILPHYLMGNIFFLLIIILFLKLLHSVILGNHAKRGDSRIDSGQARMTPRYLFLLALFSFLLAFVHPIDFLILLCSLGLFVMLNLFQHLLRHSGLSRIWILKQVQDDNMAKYQILLLLLIFVSGLLPALYYRFALSLPFWRFILAHGTTTSYNIPLLDLSLALGPVFIMGIGGIIFFLLSLRGEIPHCHCEQSEAISMTVRDRLRNDSVKLLLFSWLFVQTLFFLRFYQIFNFDRLRTMEAPFYIPLAFFATIFLIKIYKVVILSERSEPKDLTQIKSVVKDSSTRPATRDSVGMTKEKILLITITVLVLISTLPTTLILLRNQIYQVSDFKTFSLFSYPTIKQYQAWQFLRDHTPDNSAITASYEATFLIPSVSGNKIAFAGNFDNNPNFNVNKNKITQFYRGLLNPEDALNFFHTNHIPYIYWGYQEQSLGGDLTKYPFLQKIFSNGEVIIFKVK